MTELSLEEMKIKVSVMQLEIDVLRDVFTGVLNELDRIGISESVAEEVEKTLPGISAFFSSHKKEK